MNQLDIFQTKEDALQALEIARKEYLVKARAIAIKLAKDQDGLVTAHDVREVCPPPTDIDRRVMGAVLNTPDWEPCGFIENPRDGWGYNHPVRQFRYVGS